MIPNVIYHCKNPTEGSAQSQHKDRVPPIQINMTHKSIKVYTSTASLQWEKPDTGHTVI